MKRTIFIAGLLAVGLLVASAPASAQDVPAPKSDVTAPKNDFFAAQAGISLLGTSTVDSSKFQEYRDLSNGVYNPQFSILGSKKSIDFSVFANNIQQADQRYFGGAAFGWGAVAFDYNQTPHNMGNNGQSLFVETTPGVWRMNSTLRQHLADSVAASTTTQRTYPWYASLLAPTFASTNSVDLGTLRKRGNVEFGVGQKLPFDLTFSYLREVKTGSRGASGGDVLGTVTSAVDVPEPVNEVMQDFGVRWAYDVPKKANFHATFNRNVYNDRIDALVIDNPFMAVDHAANGAAQTRFSTAPDNQATRGSFGTQLKFARQTRVSADAAFGTWTQDAAFLPFTINSAMLAGNVPATSLSVLPRPSLNGKVNTTMVNVSFSSRPVPNLGVRLRYRLYDMANKTAGIQWTGSAAGNPDRTWSANTTPTADAPFGGFVTANPYSSKSSRVEGQVSYDIQDVTLEADLQHQALDRTYREAESGAVNAYGFSAVFHAKEWLGFRGTVNQLHRTAEGVSQDPTTFIGYQADEAELKRNRATVDIELTPSSMFGFTFAYSRRHDDYPNRPVRTRPVATWLTGQNLTSGLLNANYDEYTVEFDATPNARAELNLFYTYEKNTTFTQRVAVSNATANPANTFTDRYGFNGLDKGNTFGASLVLHVVPDKWTFLLNGQHQKMNGLLGMDWTLSPTNTVYLGRLALGGPQDITQYDDTKWTTALAQIDRIIGKMTLSVGYMYENYELGDAFQGPIFPQSVLFYLGANDGNYKAHLGFARLSYRF